MLKEIRDTLNVVYEMIAEFYRDNDSVYKHSCFGRQEIRSLYAMKRELEDALCFGF